MLLDLNASKKKGSVYLHVGLPPYNMIEGGLNILWNTHTSYDTDERMLETHKNFAHVFSTSPLYVKESNQKHKLNNKYLYMPYPVMTNIYNENMTKLNFLDVNINYEGDTIDKPFVFGFGGLLHERSGWDSIIKCCTLDEIESTT